MMSSCIVAVLHYTSLALAPEAVGRLFFSPADHADRAMKAWPLIRHSRLDTRPSKFAVVLVVVNVELVRCWTKRLPIEVTVHTPCELILTADDDQHVADLISI